MPRTRIYESNAARQKAYRERLKKGDVVPNGRTAVVKRVLSADKAAR